MQFILHNLQFRKIIAILNNDFKLIHGATFNK